MLGRGGMGEVHLAEDTVLDRLVAVKFICELDPDTKVREQVLTEARAAARLQHPNVLTIYRVGELDGRPFIVSEFVEGEGLDTIRMPLPWKRALEIGIGLARGLAAAHRRGVLHRDIKPGNAILTDGGVKLLDFGLAKLMDGESRSSMLLRFDRAAAVVRDAPTLDFSMKRRAEDRATATDEVHPPSGARISARAEDLVEMAAGAARQPAPSGARISARAEGGGAGAAPASSYEEQGEDNKVPEALSPASAVRGTPHYMAPEIWYGDPAIYQSDVYSLGVVLFELCTGEPPHGTVPLADIARVTVRHDAPPLAEIASYVEPRFAAIVDRCLRREPAERFASGEELCTALEQIGAASHEGEIPEGNPYRGLLPFEAEHRALFFGRTGEVGTVLERLRSEPLVVITGDSGVGKSSLCAAGVLPRVGEGALGGGRAWCVIHLVPGKHPIAALAAALSRLLLADEDDLSGQLRERPSALSRDLRRRLGEGRGAVLYIDQLEEIVTLGDPGEAELAGRALGQLVSCSPGLRLLATVRGDVLARVASLPGLGDELPRALYLLRSLSPDKIREAIVGPAVANGVSFESQALVSKLIESTCAEGLPLLQFALAELWELRAQPSGKITAEALDALGGVAGALARHADRVLLGLPMEQRAAARRILVALVTSERTRGQRTEAELICGAASRAALEALVRGRLVVARHSDEGNFYEVAHDALLKGWTTLRRWVEEQAGSVALRRRLEAAAVEWERLERTRDALWNARQLAEAAAAHPDDLGPREQASLDASESALRRNRWKRRIYATGAAALVALLYGALQLEAGREADRKLSVHLGEAAASHAEARQKEIELMAVRAEAFVAFDARQTDKGELAWARALALAAQVEQMYGRTSQALEAALAVFGGRADVRELLAGVLFERVLAAERDRDTARRDDLLERLKVYDMSGDRWRRWSAPAELTLEISPPEARIAIARFLDDPHRHLTEATPLAGSKGPADAESRHTSVEIAQGSYLLTLEAEGRAQVLYPVLLGRGEQLHLSLALPRAEEVPPGFVYVPPGRFLSGSAADEALRKTFLSTSPLHESKTGAYLIARNETTYAEWIEYLGALPPSERARRTPRVGSAGLAGALALRKLPDGEWQLEFQPTTQTITARAGESMTYSGRKLRATQRWLHLPVSGISRADADAYTSWLDAQGRVPSARLCTEQEWERAARGADDREFPSGDQLDPDDANLDHTYGDEAVSRGPDEVGSHPGSRSPFGLDDMAGNVFEWTVSSVDSSGSSGSVIRGGAYYYGELTARSTNRTTFEGTLRDPRLGLRVCASFPSR